MEISKSVKPKFQHILKILLTLKYEFAVPIECESAICSSLVLSFYYNILMRGINYVCALLYGNIA